MYAPVKTRRHTLQVLLAAAVVALFAYPGLSAAKDVKVTLTGDQEVPPVTTTAKGAGTIAIAADKSVSGSITTTGLPGTMAHIHQGAAGKNGPVVIPLSKSGDGAWSVPPGAKLTDAQYKSFEAGDLYVNIHSAAHQGGEIRGQLKP